MVIENADNPIRAYGLRIAELRKKRKLSQRELAEISGIGRMLITSLESGTKKFLPSPEQHRILARILKTSPAHLLEAAGYIDPDPLDRISPALFEAAGLLDPEEQELLVDMARRMTGGEGGYADIDFIMDFEQREAMPA